MNRFLSTQYKPLAFNFALLILRMIMGLLMIPHGYEKLVQFADMKSKFMNFLGLGSSFSLILVIFAEFFCSCFIVLGLLTRVAALVLVILTGVIVFQVHHGDFFGKASLGLLFLGGYATILLVGPGRFSGDALMGK